MDTNVLKIGGNLCIIAVLVFLVLGEYLLHFLFHASKKVMSSLLRSPANGSGMVSATTAVGPSVI